MSNLTFLTPIIASIIAVFGTILPLLIGLYISKDENRPVIDYNRLDFNYSKNFFILDIYNKGTQHATNLSLYLDTFPFTILNLTNIFSTSNIFTNDSDGSLVNIGKTISINNTYTKLYIPSLIHGEGSKILIKIVIDEKITETSNFTMSIRAIYDQGSSKIDIDFSPPALIKSVEEYYEAYAVYYNILFPLLLIVYVIIYIRYGVIKRRKNYFKELVANLITIRHKLKVDIQTDKILDISIKIDKEYIKSMDVNDYILLDDFFTILYKRNSFLQSIWMDNKLKSEDDKFNRLNKQLLEFLNKILIQINWKRYL
jgi:hypothetical protein